MRQDRDNAAGGEPLDAAGVRAPADNARRRPVPPAVKGARGRPSLEGVADMPARERAYHELKFRIMEGRLPPGTTLLEAEVANLLGLSRTPVREALIKLEEEGLVDVRPRHGISVRAQSIDDLSDIYDVFSTLEVKAVELAARRGIETNDGRRLSGILDQLERATQREDPVRWSHLDDQFHSELVSLSGNNRLCATLRQYWDQQYRARMAIVHMRPSTAQSDREHRAILQAVVERDIRRAAHLHQQHRDRADRLALELLRRGPA
ncbi:GntR family transcriptional regulator [Afifella sp. H1R]|uniref:GntR family transcriptional regulator n=1 Tax=unclassified Afifella TaxID=2624128 RepID=UPI001F37C164|nr:GntR family transcriptional regulator [Afifella sp. H1R]MCF1503716.1 GntR family transcriptional regulator [Afifella sp. H1R]